MILVLVETDPQGATLTSREALTFARGLASRSGGAPVHAVVVGPLEPEVQEGLVAHLAEQGVAELHHAQDDRLSSYAAAAWAAAVVDAVSALSAGLVVASGTPRGSEILAHVAVRTDAVMAANVVTVDEVEPLTVSRQVMGGAVLEEMRLDGALGVLSIAGHACDPEPADQPTEVTVSAYTPSLADADLRARVVRTEPVEADDTAALSEARVVVGAGRGAGGPDGFGDLLELTDLLGGSLGVSRVVTNLGWRPHHEQVGQTGTRISPDLYIPCGISGAVQHWAGCQSAKTILAINTDADAPMVTKADYAVIGDLHEIVPAINAELRKRLA
ncbi:MAG: electron transfer flavoprotein subunit alpha/FixB family protein [Propionibacteriales bacterium]|nr:electron transfer flavoprotein subunit alpha/FixB family protein [Propionibacteriales bacterium]